MITQADPKLSNGAALRAVVWSFAAKAAIVALPFVVAWVSRQDARGDDHDRRLIVLETITQQLPGLRTALDQQRGANDTAHTAILERLARIEERVTSGTLGNSSGGEP